MQAVSKEYLSQIKKIPFRNRSFADVLVGVINKEAQANSGFQSGQQWLEYSDLESPFGKEKVKNQYATYEPNYFRPSMYFVGKPYYTQGGVSKNFNNNITIDLGASYSLAGITLNFGMKYPTSFNLILDSETRAFTNHEQEFISTQPFTTRYITIQPLTFAGGEISRLRIQTFKAGYYKEFDNDTITSLDYEETISPISDEISQNTITLKAENYGRKYDVEKDDDISKFFILGQDVNVNFGYELDSGEVEYVDMGNLSLDSWDMDSESITLKATSYINTLDDTCLIGEYSSTGKTLYQLAVEVFTDLGISSNDYSIDSRLKDYTTKNPLPQLPHSQLLQIIANAGQCAVLRDRNNLYKILPTCFVNDDDIEFTITTNGHTAGSDPSKIIDLSTNIGTDYIADYSQDYIRVDNKMYFTGHTNQGYISSMIADSNGNFTTNPLLTIQMNKPMQLTGWTIDFVSAIPKTINIKSYYNNLLVESIDFSVNEQKMKCSGNFGLCNKVVIEVIKGSPNARIHISQIVTPPIVFTFTTERDVIGSTKATMQDRVKNIELETTLYEVGSSVEEAYKGEVEIQQGLDYENWDIIFNSPIIPNKVYVDNVETTPTKISGQHCVIDLSDYEVGDVVNVKVSGQQLTTKTKTFRKNIDEKGITETYQNPLIDNDTLAQDNLKWLAIYKSFNKQYEIESRGYPELEVNDLVGLEIPQLKKVAIIRLVGHKISFDNGGLKGREIALREA